MRPLAMAVLEERIGNEIAEYRQRWMIMRQAIQDVMRAKEPLPGWARRDIETRLKNEWWSKKREEEMF